MKPQRPASRAFEFRGGVRLTGTNLTCDAAGGAGDLVFLSHAQALADGRVRMRRAGRQEILCTDTTLALLGRVGATLRKHALPTPFGRAFTLGDLRLGLFPSGHLPGAASLRCETQGRRVVYAGTIRRGDPAFGAVTGEAQPAEAMCLDATFGHPRFDFPAPAEALAAVVDFARGALAAGRAPVLLATPYGGGMDVAAALAAAGITVRGHRSMVAAAAAFRAAGTPAVAIARFGGKLAPGEALLWPPQARAQPMLGTLPATSFALVSGLAADPDVVAATRVDTAIAFANQAGFADLCAYVEATFAREVALVGTHAGPLAQTLRARGLDAYVLGPPAQMGLFPG